ncbi:MAG: M16 family metallopeptidase [Thermoguttaceae bacterium]
MQSSRGLEILIEPNRDAASVAVVFGVLAGSRDETAAESGVSHFLEHMLFKGNERLGGREFNAAWDAIGAAVNAYTSEEETVYYASALAEFHDELIRLVAELAQPMLAPDDFATERNVILEEIAMDADVPPFGADEFAREIFFGEHPLSRRVLGTSETLAVLTPDAMRDYLRRHYVAENSVIVVCGDVDVGHTLRTIERYWKNFPRGVRNVRTPRAVAPTWRGKLMTHVKESAAQHHAIFFAEAPAGQSTDYEAATLLAAIVGDDSGSRLYWELVDSGRAESASLGYTAYNDTGLWCGSLSCDHEDSDQCAASTREVFASLSRHRPTHDELVRAQRKTVSRLLFGDERPLGRATSVAEEWLATQRFITTAEEIAAIERVTLADVNRIIDTWPLDELFVMQVVRD